MAKAKGGMFRQSRKKARGQGAGGGALAVVMGGDHKLRSVSIEPDVLDPEDHEMVQDLIIAAVNEATDKLEAISEERMSGLTGGLSLPGLGGP